MKKDDVIEGLKKTFMTKEVQSQHLLFNSIYIIYYMQIIKEERIINYVSSRKDILNESHNKNDEILNRSQYVEVLINEKQSNNENADSLEMPKEIFDSESTSDRVKSIEEMKRDILYILESIWIKMKSFITTLTNLGSQ